LSLNILGKISRLPENLKYDESHLPKQIFDHKRIKPLNIFFANEYVRKINLPLKPISGFAAQSPRRDFLRISVHSDLATLHFLATVHT